MSHTEFLREYKSAENDLIGGKNGKESFSGNYYNFLTILRLNTPQHLSKMSAYIFPGTSLKVGGGFEGDFSVLLWSKTEVLFFPLDLDQAEQKFT